MVKEFIEMGVPHLQSGDMEGMYPTNPTKQHVLVYKWQIFVLWMMTRNTLCICAHAKFKIKQTQSFCTQMGMLRHCPKNIGGFNWCGGKKTNPPPNYRQGSIYYFSGISYYFIFLGLLQHRALRFAWGTINSPAVVDVREYTQTANPGIKHGLPMMSSCQPPFCLWTFQLAMLDFQRVIQLSTTINHWSPFINIINHY